MTTIDVATETEHLELADGGGVDLWVCADEERVTITAWRVDGDLVGLAWFELTPTGQPRPASVEVTPTQRRRGIGSALLRRLIQEATDRKISTLTWTHPADDLAVRRLETASHAVCARRVDHGRAKSTIFVPAA